MADILFAMDDASGETAWCFVENRENTQLVNDRIAHSVAN